MLQILGEKGLQITRYNLRRNEDQQFFLGIRVYCVTEQHTNTWNIT